MAISGISRRRLLQLTGVSALGMGALALGGCQNSSDDTQDTPAAETVTLTVYDPTGQVQVTQQYAPRLDTLEGKTIGFVSDGMWQDDRTFPIIKQLLEEKYAGITVIDADQFPTGNKVIGNEGNGLPERAQELGVDGIIVGNAG